MTLMSFIIERPPACLGVAITPMWTTVSTFERSSNSAMPWSRMSTRTNSHAKGDGGGMTSSPMTRSMPGWSTSQAAVLPPRYRETPVTAATTPWASSDYFLLRRWTRVRRSNLRCFFLAIRLRRFLTTEPMYCLYSLDVRPMSVLPPRLSRRSAVKPTGGGKVVLCRLDVGVAEIVVDSLLRHPEGTPNANRGEIAVVHQPVDGHLGYAHHSGHLGDGEELHVTQRTVGGRGHGRIHPSLRTGNPVA